MSRLPKLLQLMSEARGTALHLGKDTPPRMRVKGRLIRMQVSPLTQAELDAEITALSSEATLLKIRRAEPADFPCEIDGQRYRARCFVRHDGTSLILRSTANVSNFTALGLPSTVQRLAHLRRGFVLISGPSGAGKSTTVGALMTEIESGRPKHVVTLESPIELIYSHQRTSVSQREVGTHTESFATGLAAAIRQRPDVLFASDLPDGPSVTLALDAAAAGVLVFATIRAAGVVRALEHIVELDPVRRHATLNALAEHLSAAISLLRLPSADGLGHAVAAEMLVRSRAVVASLRANDLAAIPDSMRRGDNTQTMDDALAELVASKRIAVEDAFDHARDKQRFRHKPRDRRAVRHTRLA